MATLESGCNLCGQSFEAHGNDVNAPCPVLPMPRVVPCEWGECGCPGWHIVHGSVRGQVDDDIALRLPNWFTMLGTHMYRMPNTPASWPEGPNCIGRNRLSRLVESIGYWVTEVTLNKTWVKYFPQRFWVNCHCNGGGDLTQAVVEVLSRPRY